MTLQSSIKALSSIFGLSFWPVPVPTATALQAELPIFFNDPTSAAWYVPAYTTSNVIGILLAGANSDLFGRRLFLLFGNACCCVGFIITATAQVASQFTVRLAITGFRDGFYQVYGVVAMCSIPELLPNKYRHIGICILDDFIFVIVIICPIYTIDNGDWKYISWERFVTQFFSLAAIWVYYKSPKHLKGIPWHEAYKGLDYVGTVIVPSIRLIILGTINTTSSSDVTVVAPLVFGLVLVAAFVYGKPYLPSSISFYHPYHFQSHDGREFTAPFIVTFIVTMFYYSVNIIWSTMVNMFYITPTTSRSTKLLLTLSPNIDLVFGARLLIAFRNLLGDLNWILIITWTGMTLFRVLMGLFGRAQYESVVFTRLGVAQQDLRFSSSLAGMARYSGGSLAQAIYTTIFTNTQSRRAAITLPQAAIAGGMTPEKVQILLAAFPLGAKAIAAVPRVTQDGYDTKMTDKIDVFLEDVYAEKNKFH
ncbi:hypothetical protein K469DRAFT_726188 [Zopfia rhizophila CBS 207.26]|uniref:MFS general substrate transporter n=1 Tax=Zopfia rhizophila CBS 207.26 TaxID=1314779 RepID=A0A6A6E891_9PEZI|nr:hypothetical protein K469DRAFT_726188 [Zopfia rhizophila CBS 207.26]